MKTHFSFRTLPYVAIGFLFAQPVWAGIISERVKGFDLGLGTAEPITVFKSIITWLLSFLGMLSVLLILYAGFLWMTAAGNDEKVKKGRDILLWSMIGLLIILASYGIASYVFDVYKNVTGNGVPVI